MDYTTIQPNYELRACSRQQLKGVWLSMALAFIVYGLIYAVPSYIASISDYWNIYSYFLDGSYFDYDFYDDYNGNYSLVRMMIFYVAILLTYGAFALGFAGYFLKRIRGEEIALKNIFDGFKRFWPALSLNFLEFLFIMLWSFLFIIPGIIKTFSYSMAYYIMYDDPEISALDAITKSRIMMKGYKGKLFLLYLSFIGWSLLTIFTFGIGSFWLSPYVGLSVANFYENLKRTQEKALVGDTPMENRPGETAEEEKLEIARKMKDRGRPLDEIVEDTGLSHDIVEKL
jgi:uncharacterized membrane protein